MANPEHVKILGQTVVVVSNVIFDAHAWMAGDISCVQANSTETK
jgi:hypothetical protein